MISRLSTNFHAGLHALVLAANTGTSSNHTSTTTAAKSSSSSYFFLIFIFIIVGVYLLFIRPRTQQARRAQMQQQQYEIGDRVLTRAGIVGHVVGFVDDHIQLEIANGVVIEVVRQAIGQKMPETTDDEDLVPPPPGSEDGPDDEDSGEAEDGQDADIWHIGDADSSHDDEEHDSEEAAADDEETTDVGSGVPSGGLADGADDGGATGKPSRGFGRRGRSGK
jgi:preprotein translocase subunit YajC